jgi:hypothetical protein
MTSPILASRTSRRTFNLSDTAPVVAVVARSDASEWANIIGYDRIRGAGEAERASS